MSAHSTAVDKLDQRGSVALNFNKHRCARHRKECNRKSNQGRV
jgi:hypothetical protein